MDHGPATTDELRAEIERLRASLAVDHRDAAGDLSVVDQHPADSATDLHDRERTLGRILDLEERLRRMEMGADPDDAPVPAPGDDADTTTPLDDPGPTPQDLASIPMGTAPPIDDDADQEADLDAPGMVYREGRTEPDVGEDDEDPVDRRYRPD